MSTYRPANSSSPRRDQRDAWSDTTPVPLAPVPAPPAPIDGLEIQEIDSETVFDRLFGNLPLPASSRR